MDKKYQMFIVAEQLVKQFGEPTYDQVRQAAQEHGWPAETLAQVVESIYDDSDAIEDCRARVFEAIEKLEEAKEVIRGVL